MRGNYKTIYINSIAAEKESEKYIFVQNGKLRWGCTFFFGDPHFEDIYFFSRTKTDF